MNIALIQKDQCLRQRKTTFYKKCDGLSNTLSRGNNTIMLENNNYAIVKVNSFDLHKNVGIVS